MQIGQFLFRATHIRFPSHAQREKLLLPIHVLQRGVDLGAATFGRGAFRCLFGLRQFIIIFLRLFGRFVFRRFQARVRQLCFQPNDTKSAGFRVHFRDRAHLEQPLTRGRV